MCVLCAYGVCVYLNEFLYNIVNIVVIIHCLLYILHRHKDVDIVIIRENTEGEYSGLEHEVRYFVASGSAL